MPKKSNKRMQYWKRVNLQKGHPAKAAITAVNIVLQESQAEAVSLETPNKAMEEKAKLPELLAKKSFMKRHIAENEATRLKLQ